MKVRMTLSRLAVYSFVTATMTIGCTGSSEKTDSRNPASENKSDGLEWLSVSDNEKLWGKYCSADGGANSADIPKPNYKNTLVSGAAKNFKKVAPNSLYPYPAILFAYGLKEPKGVPSGVTPEAHVFLTYLCGEFRDRATMVEAKLMWVNNFNKLGDTAQPEIKADDSTNVWMKMSAHSYSKFLAFSKSLWYARQAEIGTVTMGSYNEPAPVDGMTVCQTKYMFNEIAKNPKGESHFTTLADFNKGFESYSAKCAKADREDYYDFRGDSNFKPNSPEGNGMIWYANHIASNCKNTKQAKAAPTENVTNQGNVVTDAVCEDYFKNPFRRRWQAARAGLAAWMLHSKADDASFKDDYSGILIWPHRITENPSTLTPFAYKVPAGGEGVFSEPKSTWVDGFQASDWDRNDLNFNAIAGLGTTNADQGFTFERLRDAVNRHTNWYQSKWDDGLGSKHSRKEQAYSPFVASSYEPSESDQFTFCGITVPCPPDGFKHWMFVFRIKGKNWYRNDNIAMNGEKAQKIDFSYHWFDETSLGTTSLADAEHAWDRMGTALEDELMGGAILYLHNITDSGEVSNDNLN